METMVNQFMFVTCNNCISVTLKPVKRYLYIKQATASIVFVVSCHSSPEKFFQSLAYCIKSWAQVTN